MISIDDFLYYVDDALEGMVHIVSELGDDLANRRPDVPGANSPFAILTHCLGVMEYWGGEIVAGRSIVRDRAAEFRATGRVAELTEATERARQQLRADVAALDSFGPPRGDPHAEWAMLPMARTQGGALRMPNWWMRSGCSLLRHHSCSGPTTTCIPRSPRNPVAARSRRGASRIDWLPSMTSRAPISWLRALTAVRSIKAPSVQCPLTTLTRASRTSRIASVHVCPANTSPSDMWPISR